MISEAQNRLLTEVEGDAPMGRMMRQRYWIPCDRSESLVADGPPRHVRLLGSDYVAFRATDGRIGFFDEACPHRGTSLVLAHNADCALTCIYHAWKIDVSGKVVDVPSEGARSQSFGAQVKVNHYPTFEGGGLLWVYLGQGTPPEKPPLPFLDLDPSRVWVSRSISRCNWFQGVEGTIDSVHVNMLHQTWLSQQYGGESNIVRGLDALPRYEVEETPFGLRAAAIRHLADGRKYVRVTPYVMPFVSLVPGGGDRNGAIFISVPRSNSEYLFFWGFWNEDGPRMESEKLLTVGERDPDNWVNLEPGPQRTWGQNRAAMASGHSSGFDDCLIDEDLAVQASQGVIQDRTIEHLCSSDLGIARLRRRMLNEIAAFEQGAALPEMPQVVRPLDTIADAEFSWREFT